MSNFLVKSGRTNTGAEVRRFLSTSKLAWHFAIHSKALFFSSNFIIGLAILEKSFMNQW
jgi:hypothetical protein